MSYWGYPRYVSVGEKKQNAKKKIEQLRKKSNGIEPVIIEGRTLAHTWWGKAWNNNLEGYADYSNRIGRGRSYVRCGCVLDLKISEGKIQSLVMGSETQPYSVVVNIKAMERSVWGKIRIVCEGQLGSLQELLLGKFPKALNAIFTAHGNGLFPSPKDIDFSCSCPDWASMCKHVAATLYGVGARLDKDPNLFFALRKIEINDLISETVKGKAKELLTKAEKKSSRIIEDQDLSSVFGIELDSDSKSAKKIKAKVATKEKTTKVKKIPPKTKKISTTKTKTIKKTTKDTTTAKVAKKPTKKSKAKTPKKVVKKVSKKKNTKKL
jgi:uncharacterized Zn finger protein